ncbi:PIG-L deacetylase family protein [Parapedobacter lycopersici]|uniref:PIG-L deacetylase family protein n=1 Tax=Parapedobacter lycopersici TaxID=1864939 RepID=UPI00214D4531|nr:PIG-L family deacetylase [Parapedobacter lycopersici]
MERRKFISKSMLTGAMLPTVYGSLTGASVAADGAKSGSSPGSTQQGDVVIERPVAGRPHEGKVLAVIQPHCDDIALFAAGTVAKLISEGYTGYMIQTSNDDATGVGNTVAEQILNNEISTNAAAKALGLKKVYNLGYRNHRMDEYNIQEIKGRLIFLFRLLKVDTVVCYDPWGHYEENPDHYVTAKAVEAARWMAGSYDYPEHFDIVERHSVLERYYFARGPQRVNRVVDISNFIDTKVESNAVITSQGPGGHAGSALRNSLAKNGKKLDILGSDDHAADRNYIKHFVLDQDSQYTRGVPSDREIGKKYGLEWAEQFHYIGPDPSNIPGFVNEHATNT